MLVLVSCSFSASACDQMQHQQNQQNKMHQRQQMMTMKQQHMQRMEQHLASIDASLKELVRLQQQNVKVTPDLTLNKSAPAQ